MFICPQTHRNAFRAYLAYLNVCLLSAATFRGMGGDTMQEIVIGRNEAGQRLDKFLGKYMRSAPKSFFYRMMRKKNITLNGRKCEGTEFLTEGDIVKFFLSDDTMEKFSGAGIQKIKTRKLDILYEDAELILINKPAGMLSQKAKPEDVSLVEYLIAYLLESGAVTEEELRRFRPSVCNRLDRNTSGIVAAGKSLAGLQMLSEIFRSRSIHKDYQCIVVGEVKAASDLTGWLIKDPRTNQVKILTEQEAAAGKEVPLPIRTRYQPLVSNGSYTRLQVTLFTGRSHQIRAHLASIGHPIVGDAKYGSKELCGEHAAGLLRAAARQYGLHSQLLHSFRLEFPELSGTFASLSRRAFEAPLPEDFLRMAEGEGLVS